MGEQWEFTNVDDVKKKFIYPTEQQRQNELDDMMDWKRGWRDDYFNAQSREERIDYLCNPDTSDIEELQRCVSLLDDLKECDKNNIEKAKKKLSSKIKRLMENE